MAEFLTLKEIQLKLGVHQHVLIHLCEKGVITPDIQETEGRGKWRRFSSKNLFEFALALELRKYQMPVSVAVVVVRLLSSFERSLKKQNNDFELPESLLAKTPKVKLYLFGGEYLVFSIGKESRIGFDLVKLIKGDVKNITAKKLNSLPSDYDSHLEIDLNSLASIAIN